MDKKSKKLFIKLFNELAEESNQTALQHGFDNTITHELIQIDLMHSELGEATEAYRKDIIKSDHIPKFTGMEEEFSDVILRIANMAAAKNLKVGEAIIAKAEYNKTREFKHGNKRC